MFYSIYIFVIKLLYSIFAPEEQSNFVFQFFSEVKTQQNPIL